MKTTSVFKSTMAFMLLFTIISFSSVAQEGKRMMAQKQEMKPHTNCRIPNLTEEQETKIDALRVAHMKEMNALRADLRIKDAELDKMSTADAPDTKAINAKIDEIGKIKNDMAKKRMAHRLDVRALLNDEQKVFFDAHSGKGFGKRGHGYHNGMGNGQGKGKGHYGRHDCRRYDNSNVPEVESQMPQE